jgi:hypothetical protein
MDELPQNNTRVIVCDSISKSVSTAIYEDEGYQFYVLSFFMIPEDFCVTHWMNLPKYME